MTFYHLSISVLKVGRQLVGSPTVAAFFMSKRHIVNTLRTSKTSIHTTGQGEQRTVFRYAQKACWKGLFGEKLFFLIKIENFYRKKQLISKETLPARLLSVAKNSALFALSSSMYRRF